MNLKPNRTETNRLTALFTMSVRENEKPSVPLARSLFHCSNMCCARASSSAVSLPPICILALIIEEEENGGGGGCINLMPVVVIDRN